MKTRYFDVCVIGEGISGMVTALHLQKRGLRVAFLYRDDPDPFDPDRFEFLNGFTLRSALKRLGFHPTEVNSIPPLDAPIQMVLQDQRLDCYGDEAKFAREVMREFPENAEPIQQLFRESYGHLEIYQHLFNSRTPVPPDGLFARRKFQKVIEQVCDANLLRPRKLKDELQSFGVGPEFSQAIEAMEMAVTNLITPWTSGAHLAHLLSLVRWEGHAASMGPLTIKKMLMQKLRERSAKLLPYKIISDVQMTRKGIEHFKLEGAEWSEVGAKAYVVAGNPRGLVSLLPKTDRGKKWTRELDELKLFARRVFMIYRIREEGIPIGLRTQGIMIPKKGLRNDERRKWVRALSYVLRIEESEEEGVIELGARGLIPPTNDEISPIKIAEEIHQNLKSVIPFLDEFLVEEPMGPFVNSVEPTPGDFKGGFIYTMKKPPYLGAYGISPKTPLKNTFQTGEMIFPGLGLDGEIIAGHQAAFHAADFLSANKTADL